MELYREEEAAQSSALQRRLSVPWMPALHDTRENPLGRRTTGAVRTRGTLRRNVPPRPGVRPPSDVDDSGQWSVGYWPLTTVITRPPARQACGLQDNPESSPGALCR